MIRFSVDHQVDLIVGTSHEVDPVATVTWLEHTQLRDLACWRPCPVLVVKRGHQGETERIGLIEEQ